MAYTKTGPFTDGSGSPGISAAFLNGAETELSTDWTAYTPTFTGLTVGNGTFNANRWRYVGSALVYYIIDFTLGSTSTVTGTPTISLPVASADSYGIFTGQMQLGGNYYDCYPHHNAGVIRLRTRTVSGTALRLNDTTSTVPATWATSDKFEIHGLYRV